MTNFEKTQGSGYIVSLGELKAKWLREEDHSKLDPRAIQLNLPLTSTSQSQNEGYGLQEVIDPRLYSFQFH